MIYMFLANGFEETEALAPLDLLIRAGADIKTVAVGSDGKSVVGAHGIGVEADITEDELVYENIEMIILPGGMPGSLNLDASPFANVLIEAVKKNGGIIAAICAAPLVLGRRGLLEGKRAVCYPGFEKELIGATISEAPVCLSENIITAAGAGVAAEFGFEILSYLKSKNEAEQLKRAMKYI